MARHYPDFINKFVQLGEYSEIPESLNWWAAVSTIAGALQRKVWIDEVRYQIYPNMYIIFVGPPGRVKKSGAVTQAERLLRQVEGVQIGPQSITTAALIMKMGEATRLETVSPKTDTLSVYDSMVSMSCMSFYPDELGTFLDLGDPFLLPALISLYDCKAHIEKATKTQGDDYIKNAWLNLLAGTTPAWIRKHMTPEDFTNGFASRCVHVYEDFMPRDVAHPSRHIQRFCPDYKLHEGHLLHDLREIAELRGPFKLSDGAYDYSETWYKGLRDHIRRSPENPAVDSYLSRKQLHLLKLGMILSASHRSDLMIEQVDLMRADAALTKMEKKLDKVFGAAMSSPVAHTANTILQLVEEKGEIDRSMLFKLLARQITRHDFLEALRTLLDTKEIVLRDNKVMKNESSKVVQLQPRSTN